MKRFSGAAVDAPHNGTRRRGKRLGGIWGWLFGLLALASVGHAAESGWLDKAPEFLPVDDAFALSAEVDGEGALLARWKIADGYYLYRHGFGFKASEAHNARLGEPEIPPGKAKVDEYFGAVEVYYGNARARLPVRGEGGTLEVGIGYQGCAEAGLCYPPQTRWMVVDPGTATVNAMARDAP